MNTESILKEPYQVYADSPTIKSYVKWELYNKYIEKLIKNEINIGGKTYSIHSEYDIVLNGDTLIVNTQEINVTQSNPIGIINPQKDKLTKIHYYLIKEKVHRINLNSGEYNILSVIPKEESIIPQHLVIDINGQTSLKIFIRGERSLAYRSLILEINVNKSSELNLLVIQDEYNLQAPSNTNIGIRLDQYSRLNMLTLIKPGVMTRYHSTVIIDGEYGEAHIRDIALLKDRNRADHSMNIINRAKYTYSQYLFTGLVMNEAIIAQKGLGKITSKADGSGIEYYTEALINDENAKAYLQPRLEIDTGNVTVAKHAARNIQILPEQIFYLQTRGLRKDNAKRLIMQGYLTKQLTIERYKEILFNKIIEFLNTHH